LNKKEVKERKSWNLQELKLLDNIRIATERIEKAHLKAAKLHAKRSNQIIYQPGEEVLIWRRQAKTNIEKGSHKKLISVFEGPSARSNGRWRSQTRTNLG